MVGSMVDDIIIDQFIIPDEEMEIIASRSGGSGGQHVNKTDSRITVRWNVNESRALDNEQKMRILQNLRNRLTGDGDLLVHCDASRSQQQNREDALLRLAKIVREALYVPKKRKATRVSKAAKETRLREKTHRSETKKQRGWKF